MFTGIVEARGSVEALERVGDSARLTVAVDGLLDGTRHGDSIAVSGCCLTVVESDGSRFTADVMRETLDHTALGSLVPGTQVNLERAVTPQTRLGGHVVQGHVDGVGTVVGREHGERWDVLAVDIPPQLSRYVALKGSVAVDGVSLTVSGLVEPHGFEVSLIPTTLAATTLGRVGVGDPVNVEVDVIAKYVERLLEGKSDG